MGVEYIEDGSKTGSLDEMSKGERKVVDSAGLTVVDVNVLG